MGHHFHLGVETPQPNLVAGMKGLLGTSTARCNRRHKLFGHHAANIPCAPAKSAKSAKEIIMLDQSSASFASFA